VPSHLQPYRGIRALAVRHHLSEVVIEHLLTNLHIAQSDDRERAVGGQIDAHIRLARVVDAAVQRVHGTLAASRQLHVVGQEATGLCSIGARKGVLELQKGWPLRRWRSLNRGTARVRDTAVLDGVRQNST
jgi:hypothetical protein